MRKRQFVEFMAAVSSGGTLFGNAVLLMAPKDGKVSREMMLTAEQLARVKFTKAQRELMIPIMEACIQSIERIRQVSIPLELAPEFCYISNQNGIWSIAPKKIMEG
jgi:hypothetical protein